ncbi:MAG: class I SAM-dependent methyltransferase [Oscillospiraceae bacterium]|nr:class I SAM-dependent methyltransferase [Oscillospiraceae bacterium]
MIDSKEVAAFFDRLAPDWDAEMIRSDEIIAAILDKAEVSAGKDVLDVATGTGVLIGDYLARGVASVTGIDISPNMARIARGKYPQETVKILCGDVERTDFDRLFDCIVVYNAFPHFPDPARLIARLAALLRPGGTLTVAHGMSREKIDAHHHGAASRVSNGLMSAEDLAAIFAGHLTVTAVISDDRMYQVVGKKN